MDHAFNLKQNLTNAFNMPAHLREAFVSWIDHVEDRVSGKRDRPEHDPEGPPHDDGAAKSRIEGVRGLNQMDSASEHYDEGIAPMPENQMEDNAHRDDVHYEDAHAHDETHQGEAKVHDDKPWKLADDVNEVHPSDHPNIENKDGMLETHNEHVNHPDEATTPVAELKPASDGTVVESDHQGGATIGMRDLEQHTPDVNKPLLPRLQEDIAEHSTAPTPAPQTPAPPPKTA